MMFVISGDDQKSGLNDVIIIFSFEFLGVHLEYRHPSCCRMCQYTRNSSRDLVSSMLMFAGCDDVRDRNFESDR